LIRSVLMWCRSASLHARRAVAVVAGGSLIVLVAGLFGVSSAAAGPGVLGLDVSSHQNSINWTSVASHGAQFAYIKATEGLGFVNPDFASQYNGAYQARLIRGAYDFALPNDSSGAAQARYFVANGGGWSADGRTLPGSLDIENNPYGAECYKFSKSAMVAWIASFDATYEALTSVWPVIYTNSQWWAKCTGNYGGFASQDPLWMASYGATPGLGGWPGFTFWQYSTTGTFPGDQDLFNGSRSQLIRLATAAP
jgi:GH25 family lysozyme M1 (1,4-beta-N-acetylmuramidase)